MPIERSKRHFIRLLRRSAKGAASSAASRNAAEESAFWLAHERALNRSREAAEAAQRIASVVAKQRASVDALSDRSRAVSARAQELSATFARVADVFDRLGLVALNAGLEGARLGETAGRAVLLVSDEVRTHALRGAEAVRELASALTEMGADLSQLHASFDGPREAAVEMAQHAALAAGAASDAERALAEIEVRIRQATGSDPETARALSEANEHVQSLMTTLGTLGSRLPHDELMSALRPMLEPLARVLADDEAEQAEHDDAAAAEKSEAT
ncbi:MAG TPA: methyl-accepting chemotaxis protein [Polyangiaceae bacterium]|nr:methyl-accepting chemotaxis protein [Polyangiaceae bacterium]